MVNNPTDFQKAKKDAKSFAEQEKGGIKSSIAQVAEHFKTDFKNSNLKKDLQDKFESAGEAAREYGEQLREKTDEAVQYIEHEVRVKPLKAVAVAFGAGALAALLFWRRK